MDRRRDSQLRLVAVTGWKRRRRGVRFGVIGVSILVMVAASIYVAQASHNFSDVPTEAFYHSAVEWIVTRGITAGCAVGLYCPDAAVTRGTMAVFLQRLGQYIETLLSVPGMINVTTNPVDWTKLKGVPSGIADGLDNDSGGDITQVTAGAGLSGGGASGVVTLAAGFGGTGGDFGAANSVARSDHSHGPGQLRGFKIEFSTGVNSNLEAIFNFGGLLLQAQCSGLGDLHVQAHTGVNNSAFWIFGHLNEIAVTDWDVGETILDILAEADNTAGTIAYARPDGGMVTVNFMAEETPFGPDGPDWRACFFGGSALWIPP